MEAVIKKIGFFSEDANSRSMMRLLSFILLVFLIIFDVLYVTNVFFYREVLANAHADPSVHLIPLIDMNFILFNFVLLIGIFVPKYLQKLAELKLGAIGTPIITTSHTESTSTDSTKKGTEVKE
jgi:heme/copper-type cytochrome/quinol oxidase subunit 2